MPDRIRPYRSILYMPGSNRRALAKLKTISADGAILDLEDAVSPDSKDIARREVAATVSSGDHGERMVMVRVNGFDSPWFASDLDVICASRPQALLLPKASDADDILRLDAELKARPKTEGTSIWAMIETTRGVLNAGSIAGASARLEGFVLGTNDLARELGCSPGKQREPLLVSLSLVLLAARSHDLVCVDGVYNAFRDLDGLHEECQQGRDFGFDGKSLIHPLQVAVANKVFAPSDTEVDLARRQLAAFEEATAKGSGIAVVDGRIVENLHVEMARRTLARARMIAGR